MNYIEKLACNHYYILITYFYISFKIIYKTLIRFKILYSSDYANIISILKTPV